MGKTRKQKSDYYKQRYYEMKHGLRERDKSFNSACDKWEEMTYKELVEMDANMFSKKDWKPKNKADKGLIRQYGEEGLIERKQL